MPGRLFKEYTGIVTEWKFGRKCESLISFKGLPKEFLKDSLKFSTKLFLKQSMQLYQKNSRGIFRWDTSVGNSWGTPEKTV